MGDDVRTGRPQGYEADVALRAEQDELAQLRSLGATMVTTPELKIDDFVANARKLDPDLKDKWGPYYDQILSARR